MKKLSLLFSRLSSTPVAALSFAVSVLFIAFVLPHFSTLIDTASSGMGMPDRLFYYNAERLGQIVQAYSAQGRWVYVRCAATYDTAWPAIYISFLCISISWLNNFSLKPDSRFKQLNLIPLICALFDAFENLNLSIIMMTFPDTLELLLNTAGIFTAGKWVAAGLSFSVLTGSIIHAVLKQAHKVP